jgi:minor extracellular serine protease Vpr
VVKFLPVVTGVTARRNGDRVKRRGIALLAAVSTSAVLGAMALPATATATSASASPGGESRAWQELSLQTRDGERSEFRPAALDPDGLVTVMLEMDAEPVAQAQAEAAEDGGELSDTARGQLRGALRERQVPVEKGVQALDGQVLASTQDAFNGVKVRVPRSSLAQVSQLPGVVAVHAVPTFERTNEQSVPFLGVPQQVWESLGLTGEGVSIGVIDTGIDYTHADFGGPGTVEAYESNDPTVIEPATFPTAKVVGGYDFVGDAYDASANPRDPAALPQPDPDPLDCNGHGSHVSGTAAGLGVLADGTTYQGPYDSSTYDNDFTVGPGVAPQASLYALKVFGCEGSTDVTVEAINWAVANDLDVINLSLGSPFSALGDAGVEALNNAALAGVVPVLSAGNEGDITYIVGSPGTAERAISVAAIDTVESFPGAQLSAGDVSLQLQVSNEAPIDQPITGELVVLQDDPATADVDESLGCTAEDYSEVSTGDIVVTFRGVCPRIDRATLGQAAGAAAVVMVNDAPGLPPVEGPIEDVTIPFLGATPEQGEQLSALNGQQVTVTSAGPIPNPNFRAPAGFTSGGPGLAGDIAKPDVAAPGVSIVSTGFGTGTGAATISGTSMASPHVAGVAALVRQGRPDDSVETVKAAIINTADPEGTTDYSTLRLGAGLVDADEAVQTPVVVVGDEGTASLSFGFHESTRTITQHKTVTLRNTSERRVRFSVSVDESTQPEGTTSVSVFPRSVTVAGGGEAKVRVTITVTPSTDLPSGEFQAASGTVLFTPSASAGATKLRVPYVLVHRAVSDLDTWPNTVRMPRDGTAEFRTWNESRVAGTADVYAWGITDRPNDDVITGGLAPDIRAAGVQSFPDDGMGVFAVNSFGRLGTASAAEYDVLVDTNDDGSPEFAVIGLDLGLFTTGVLSGQFASIVLDIATGEAVSAYLAGGAINSSTVLLPFAFADVGLSEANPDFLYDVDTHSILAAGADEVDRRGTFNVFDQPVETGQFLQIPGRSAANWDAAVNAEQLKKTRVNGWMVVYLQNETGADQAELIRLR